MGGTVRRGTQIHGCSGSSGMPAVLLERDSRTVQSSDYLGVRPQQTEHQEGENSDRATEQDESDGHLARLSAERVLGRCPTARAGSHAGYA